MGPIVDNDTADHRGMAFHIPVVGGESSGLYPLRYRVKFAD